MYDKSVRREGTGKRSLVLSKLHRACGKARFCTDVDFVEFDREGEDQFRVVAVLEWKKPGSELLSHFQEAALICLTEQLSVPLYIVQPDAEVDDLADLSLCIYHAKREAGQVRFDLHRRVCAAGFDEFLSELRTGKFSDHHVDVLLREQVERHRGDEENDLRGIW